MSLSGVWRLLQRCDLRVRSAQVQHYSPDPDYVTKQAHLLNCLRMTAQEPERVALVFLDEMGYHRWPEPTTAWTPQAPSPVLETERDGTSQQQWRVIGALNALTGQVDYREKYIVGREQVIAFYRQLDQAYGTVERL
jgi:hypothetical protein